MKILCVDYLTNEDEKKIRELCKDHDLVITQDKEEIEKVAPEANVVLGSISPALAKKCPDLKWIQTSSAGVDHFIREKVLPDDCLLTNATGTYGLAISEYMIGVYLELIKGFHYYRDQQKDGAWTDLGTVKCVSGSTVLILGMGDIGTDFAKICKAMGAKVIGVRRTDKTPSPYADEIHLIEDLDQLLPVADCVAIAMPGTSETYNMFGKEKFDKMKDGAVLINVGRGTIVETEALCDALESGKLAGAGLDVVNPEPLPKDHRLWQIKSAVITPHNSGQSNLQETKERLSSIITGNLERYINGEKLRNTVDFSTGYRKL